MKLFKQAFLTRLFMALLPILPGIVFFPALSEGAPLKIGDQFGGGTVAYILEPGDPGYAEVADHFLIAAKADISETFEWTESKAAMVMSNDDSYHDRYMRSRDIHNKVAVGGSRN